MCLMRIEKFIYWSFTPYPLFIVSELHEGKHNIYSGELRTSDSSFGILVVFWCLDFLICFFLLSYREFYNSDFILWLKLLVLVDGSPFSFPLSWLFLFIIKKKRGEILGVTWDKDVGTFVSNLPWIDKGTVFVENWIT